MSRALDSVLAALDFGVVQRFVVGVDISEKGRGGKFYIYSLNIC